MLVPPGRTVIFTQTSSQVDPVLYVTPGAGSTIVDDNSGGGTSAQVAYTNTGTLPVRVVIRPSTPFYDYGETTGIGTYTLTAAWGP
jgi:hypothetical protein